MFVPNNELAENSTKFDRKKLRKKKSTTREVKQTMRTGTIRSQPNRDEMNRKKRIDCYDENKQQHGPCTKS